MPLIAAAIPASRPPPPVQTRTVRTSGHSSRTSRPTVPCPATMSAWSNGWIRTAPVSDAYCRARTRASSTDNPMSSTWAPYPRVASSLGIGALVGMNTVDEMPNSWAARATPCAWLPALAATTPRAFSCAESRHIRVYAPRILNEPARCRFSHLRCTGPPTRSDNARLYSSGVGRTTPASRSRAARTSSSVTRCVVVDMAGVWHLSGVPRPWTRCKLAWCDAAVTRAPGCKARWEVSGWKDPSERTPGGRPAGGTTAARDVRATRQRDARRAPPRRGRARLPGAPSSRAAPARHGDRRGRRRDGGPLPSEPPRHHRGADRPRRPAGGRRPGRQLPPALRPLRRQPAAARPTRPRPATRARARARGGLHGPRAGGLPRRPLRAVGRRGGGVAGRAGPAHAGAHGRPPVFGGPVSGRHGGAGGSGARPRVGPDRGRPGGGALDRRLGPGERPKFGRLASEAVPVDRPTAGAGPPTDPVR